METSRDDFGIAIRSAFLRKDTKQRFSLFALIIISIFLIFFERLEVKFIKYFRSAVQDTIYRGSEIASYPFKKFGNSIDFLDDHFNLYKNYKDLREENNYLKTKISTNDFLNLENQQRLV